MSRQEGYANLYIQLDTLWFHKMPGIGEAGTHAHTIRVVCYKMAKQTG